jgi:hypothetical protein
MGASILALSAPLALRLLRRQGPGRVPGPCGGRRRTRKRGIWPRGLTLEVVAHRRAFASRQKARKLGS